MKSKKDEIEARLTAADRAHLFRALGVDPDGGKRGPDGWIHELRRPEALGSDRNPSFAVNLETGACKDFGSDYTADLYRLTEDVRRCTFPEALEWIASELRMNGAETGAEPARSKLKWDPFRDGRRTVFSYHDEDGTELFQVVRFDTKEDHPAHPSKTFLQRYHAPEHPDAKRDGYVWRAPERLVPFGLPAVLEAARAGRVVFVGEGEKVVHALRDMGFTATCNPGGAGKWRPEYSACLEGAHVVILPDNDEQGRKHAESVATWTAGVAASVRVVELPDLPRKGDAADWKAAGHTAEELKALVQAAPVWQPGALSAGPDVTEASDSDEHLPTLPQRAYDLLPGILSDGCRCFRHWYERDVFLSGALGTLSALLPRVRFRYGKEYLSPHLFFFVLAKAGRGKGALKYALALADDVDALLQAEYAQERILWEERKRVYEQHQRSRKKGEGGPEPPGPEPPEVLLRAAEDTTLPALYKTLEANPEGVLIGATEADIISQANRRGDFGGFSALFRQAFHHESGQKATKSEGTVRVKTPRIALVLSGTHDQFEPLVESVENGLFSRFAVYRFQAPLVYQSQRPRPEDDDFARYLTGTRARLVELYEALRQRTAPLYVDTPAALWERIDAAFEDLFNRVLKDAGAPDELAASVFRAAVIAFRIAAVLCVLRRYEEGCDLSRVKSLDVGEDDVEAATALALVYVEQSMRQALRMLETVMEMRKQGDAKARALDALSLTGGAGRMTGQQRAFLDALPDTFERREAVDVGTAQGVNERTVDKWLKKFSEGETAVFSRPGHGVYEKRGAALPGSSGSMGSLRRNEPETTISAGQFEGGMGSLPGSFETDLPQTARETAQTARGPNGQFVRNQPEKPETAQTAHSARPPASLFAHPTGSRGDGAADDVPVDFIFTDDGESSEAPF